MGPSQPRTSRGIPYRRWPGSPRWAEPQLHCGIHDTRTLPPNAALMARSHRTQWPSISPESAGRTDGCCPSWPAATAKPNAKRRTIRSAIGRPGFTNGEQCRATGITPKPGRTGPPTYSSPPRLQSHLESVGFSPTYYVLFLQTACPRQSAIDATTISIIN